MEPSDRELVNGCIAGDREAFARLVSRYQTLVCSIAFSITGDFARSEDVGQDAFIAAWKQLAELVDRDRFKAWLSGITRNLAHNAMRRDKRLRFGEHPDPVTSGRQSPMAEAARDEEFALVSAALARLPENYREPLVLFYRQTQSVVEVADTLDLTTDVVKQRLSRGRKMLRDEMLSAVERTLKKTTPTHAFTLAVIAAISALTSTTAVAAVAGSTATLVKSASGAGAVKAGGLLGSALGTAAGFGGAAIGTWVSWSTAKYQSQRDLIRKLTLIYTAGILIFMLPFVAIRLGWRPVQSMGTGGYLIAYGIWMTVFMVANVVWIVRSIQRAKEITKRAQAECAVELPVTPIRRWLAQWEGRRWRTQWMAIGRPLIDIAFADPNGEQLEDVASARLTAKGWIAIGDRARGLVLAIGNTAVAPIAIGTMSCGIISFGVVSIGVVSVGVVSIAALALGGLAIGGWSVGGAVAVGYLAAAPAAFGCEAAHGAVAIAFHYADGAKAIAEHASEEMAKEYFASSTFFQRASGALEWIAARASYFRWSVALMPPALLCAFRLAFRRKTQGPATDQ